MASIISSIKNVALSVLARRLDAQLTALGDGVTSAPCEAPIEYVVPVQATSIIDYLLEKAQALRSQMYEGEVPLVLLSQEDYAQVWDYLVYFHPYYLPRVNEGYILLFGMKVMPLQQMPCIAIPAGCYGHGADAAIPDDTALSWEAWNAKVDALLAECGAHHGL